MGLFGSFFPPLLLPLSFICLFVYFIFGFVGDGDDDGFLFEFEIFWLLGSNPILRFFLFDLIIVDL